MKRSQKCRAIALTTVSAITLVACGEEPPVDRSTDDERMAVYSSLDDCKVSYTEEQCREYKLVAEEQHEKTAPRYASREECEAQHGAEKCKATPTAAAGTPSGNNQNSSSSGSFFMPMMLGYMLGNMTASRAPMPVYSGPTRTEEDRKSDRRSYYSGGRFVGSGSTTSPYVSSPSTYVRPASPSASPSHTTSTPSASSPGVKAPASVPSTVSRGGFGASASSHGGGGS